MVEIYISSDSIAPLEREIRDLANGLQSVKDEQEYIVLREKMHRNTAESTNDRVKWWSILQAVVLFSVCGWQIYHLRVRGMIRLQLALAHVHGSRYSKSNHDETPCLY